MKKRFEFSKMIIILETIAAYYSTYKTLGFVEQCITLNYLGSLPFLTTLISVIWAAYGTSISFYYNKAKAENVQGGITFESAVKAAERDC